MKLLLTFMIGAVVGVAASFTGLGGGFVMVPLLLFMGFSAQKAVGTSFLAIFIISVSALFAHGRLDNVDWRIGLLLGLGGIAGAQIGPRLLAGVETGLFRRLFALILGALACYLFFKE